MPAFDIDTLRDELGSLADYIQDILFHQVTEEHPDIAPELHRLSPERLRLDFNREVNSDWGLLTARLSAHFKADEEKGALVAATVHLHAHPANASAEMRTALNKVLASGELGGLSPTAQSALRLDSKILIEHRGQAFKPLRLNHSDTNDTFEPAVVALERELLSGTTQGMPNRKDFITSLHALTANPESLTRRLDFMMKGLELNKTLEDTGFGFYKPGSDSFDAGFASSIVNTVERNQEEARKPQSWIQPVNQVGFELHSKDPQVAQSSVRVKGVYDLKEDTFSAKALGLVLRSSGLDIPLAGLVDDPKSLQEAAALARELGAGSSETGVLYKAALRAAQRAASEDPAFKLTELKSKASHQIEIRKTFEDGLTAGIRLAFGVTTEGELSSIGKVAPFVEHPDNVKPIERKLYPEPCNAGMLLVQQLDGFGATDDMRKAVADWMDIPALSNNANLDNSTSARRDPVRSMAEFLTQTKGSAHAPIWAVCLNDLTKALAEVPKDWQVALANTSKSDHHSQWALQLLCLRTHPSINLEIPLPPLSGDGLHYRGTPHATPSVRYHYGLYGSAHTEHLRAWSEPELRKLGASPVSLAERVRETVGFALGNADKRHDVALGRIQGVMTEDLWLESLNLQSNEALFALRAPNAREDRKAETQLVRVALDERGAPLKVLTDPGELLHSSGRFMPSPERATRQDEAGLQDCVEFMNRAAAQLGEAFLEKARTPIEQTLNHASNVLVRDFQINPDGKSASLTTAEVNATGAVSAESSKFEFGIKKYEGALTLVRTGSTPPRRPYTNLDIDTVRAMEILGSGMVQETYRRQKEAQRAAKPKAKSRAKANEGR